LIQSMGGVGKTTLAAVYVTEFYDDYDHIVWLTLEGSLQEAIAANSALLENLGLKNTPADQQLSACLNALRCIESAKPNLLVLDNCVDNLSAWYDELPKPPGWHLLATSRQRLAEFDILDLDFLTETEAIALFEKYNTRFTRDEAQRIVQAVERHTLILGILAKSAQKNRWSFASVTQALAKNARAGVKVKHHHQKIDRIKSYLTSIFDMSALHDHEIYLLQQFIALPNQWIQYDFLTELLQTATLDWRDAFSENLGNLYGKGYLLQDESSDLFKMHPVLVETLALGLAPTFTDLQHLTEQVTALLKIDQAADNPIDKFQYVAFGDAILKQLSDEDAAEISTLQNNLALVYEDLGEYEKACELLEAALKSDMENFGDEHPTVATRQSNLAFVYQDLGEYKKARELWVKAHDIFFTVFGAAHPHTKFVKESLEDLENR